MGRPSFLPKIKHETELRRDVAAEIIATPGREKIFSCLQCGPVAAPAQFPSMWTILRGDTRLGGHLRHNRGPSALTALRSPRNGRRNHRRRGSAALLTPIIPGSWYGPSGRLGRRVGRRVSLWSPELGAER